MHLLSPFVLQESETKRLRVVGGGGVLSKSDMGRRANNRGLLRRSSYDESLTTSRSDHFLIFSVSFSYKSLICLEGK